MNLGADLKRIGGVFFSPVPTFKDIGARPSWLVPLLLIAAMGLAAGLAAVNHIDWGQTVRNQLEATGFDMPPERIEEAVQRQERIGPIMGRVAPPVATVLTLVILSLIYWGGTNAFGGRIGFSGSLAVASWGWLPKLIESLLFIILVRNKGVMTADSLVEVVATSPAVFLGEASPVLRAFAGSFNVFTLWALGLTGLGLAEGGRLSRGSAFTLMAILFGVNVALWTGISALTGR